MFATQTSFRSVVKWPMNRIAGRDPIWLFRVLAVKVLVQIPPKFEEDFREVGRIVIGIIEN